MSIWYKYFGISEEVLLVLLFSGVPLVLLLSGDLQVLLSEDPDLPWFSFPRIPIFLWFHYPTVLGYFFILHEFLKFFE